jgi:hypothetical protein
VATCASRSPTTLIRATGASPVRRWLARPRNVAVTSSSCPRRWLRRSRSSSAPRVFGDELAVRVIPTAPWVRIEVTGDTSISSRRPLRVSAAPISSSEATRDAESPRAIEKPSINERATTPVGACRADGRPPQAFSALVPRALAWRARREALRFTLRRGGRPVQYGLGRSQCAPLICTIGVDLWPARLAPEATTTCWPAAFARPTEQEAPEARCTNTRPVVFRQGSGQDLRLDNSLRRDTRANSTGSYPSQDSAALVRLRQIPDYVFGVRDNGLAIQRDTPITVVHRSRRFPFWTGRTCACTVVEQPGH